MAQRRPEQSSNPVGNGNSGSHREDFQIEGAIRSVGAQGGRSFRNRFEKMVRPPPPPNGDQARTVSDSGLASAIDLTT